MMEATVLIPSVDRIGSLRSPSVSLLLLRAYRRPTERDFVDLNLICTSVEHEPPSRFLDQNAVRPDLWGQRTGISLDEPKSCDQKDD